MTEADSTLPAFGSRYAVDRLLGRGATGQVWLAQDHERGEPVALKLFAPKDGDTPAGRFLFEQEFWTLAGLAHPQLVRAHDFGRMPDGRPYFAMEVAQGEDLDEGPVAPDELKRWLPGLLAALAFLHRRGLVHADLKPANIRVAPGGAVKLMDLGLLAPVGTLGAPIRGSLAYIAPEAIRQGALDGRADLYGLGAVLYHLLAGEPPFAGAAQRGVLALLHAHLEADPAPLDARVPDLPAGWGSTVMALLAKDPAARPASAAEVARALGLATTDESAPALFASPLVGREAAREHLLAVAETPGARLGLVGEEGSGKSRLLADLRARAQLAGMTVFSAAGRGTDAAPYEAVRPWLRALARGGAAELLRHAAVLARVLPELGVEPAPALEGPQEARRLQASVFELASATAPDALWLLDDADRLDPASAALVQALERRGAGTRWRWLHTSRPAQEAAEGVLLEPLSTSEMWAIAIAMLGGEPPAEAMAVLAQLAAGWPGRVQALLAHWLQVGALRRDGNRWASAPDVPFAPPAGAVWTDAAGLSGLAEASRQLAVWAAVLGEQGSLRALRGLAGLDDAAFFAALADLERRGVLVRGQGDDFSFVRPVQVLALLSELGPAAARAHHGRAAAWWAADLGSPRAAGVTTAAQLLVADQALRGDDPPSGVPWALEAARGVVATGAFAQAERLLRRAHALSLPGAPGREIAAALAATLRHGGRVDEALALLQARVVPDWASVGPAERAREQTDLALLLQMGGRYAEALPVLEAAMAAADAAGSRSDAVRARIYAGRVAHFAGDTSRALACMSEAVTRARASHEGLLLAGALGFYGYLVAASDPGRLAEGLALLEEAVQANEAIGDIVEAHEALDLRGNVLMAAGRLAEAREAFEACLAICRRHGLEGEAIFAHLNLGAVALERGTVEPALQHAREAVAMSAAQGRKYPQSYGFALEGLALVRAGEPRAGTERLSEGLALARSIENRYITLTILAYQAEACLTLGRFALAREAASAARALEQATGNQEQAARLGAIDLALAALDPGTAEPGPEEAVPSTVRARWAASAALGRGALDLAAEILATAPSDPDRPLLAAELDWLAGEVARRQSETEAAAEHFSRGLEMAAGLGHAVVALQCLAGLIDVGAAARGAMREGKRRLESLLEGLSNAERGAWFSHPEHGGLAGLTGWRETAPDRWERLTELAAAVAGEPDAAQAMHAALWGFMELAQVTGAHLLWYRGLNLVEQTVAGDASADRFSTTVAYKVLWARPGEVVFAQDVSSDEAFDQAASVQALGVRSVLGLPLADAEGNACGVLLAESTRVLEPPDEDLEALLRAYARLVAPALVRGRELAEAHDRLAEAEARAALARALMGARDLEEAFGHVARAALARCGGDRALLLAGPELACLAACDARGQALAVGDRQASSSVATWVRDAAEPLHLMDAQDAQDFQAHSVMALGLRTVWAVPVGDGATPWGVLYLDARRVLDADAGALTALQAMAELLAHFSG